MNPSCHFLVSAEELLPWARRPRGYAGPAERHPMPGALCLIKPVSNLILLTNQDNCGIIKLAGCMEMPA